MKKVIIDWQKNVEKIVGIAADHAGLEAKEKLLLSADFLGHPKNGLILRLIALF